MYQPSGPRHRTLATAIAAGAERRRFDMQQKFNSTRAAGPYRTRMAMLDPGCRTPTRPNLNQTSSPSMMTRLCRHKGKAFDMRKQQSIWRLCSASPCATSTIRLSNLSTQLATGVEVGPTMPAWGSMKVRGVRGAVVADCATSPHLARSHHQRNHLISAANTALQSLSDKAAQVQSARGRHPQNPDRSGQTYRQRTLSRTVLDRRILNTQVGDR